MSDPNNNPFEDEQNLQEGDLDKTLASLARYIRELQDVEQSMYRVLRNSPNLDDSAKEVAVNKINDLSSRRESLSNQMRSLGERAKLDLKVDFQTFQQQMRIVEAAERQLNESKTKLKLLNDEKINKLRLVQINTYYEKRYDALGDLSKYFVVFMGIAILFGVVMQKGLIPANVGSIVLAVYFGIGIVVFYLYYADIQKRSTTNFDEYEWKFDRNMTSEEVADYDKGEGDIYTGDKTENTEDCQGEECCTDGMKYDKGERRCITEEAMTSALTQNIFSSVGDRVQVSDTGQVQAFSENYEKFASF